MTYGVTVSHPSGSPLQDDITLSFAEFASAILIVFANDRTNLSRPYESTLVDYFALRINEVEVVSPNRLSTG